MDTTRLQLLSELALAANGEARPIHMLRPGTFTDMHGREVTFSADDLSGVAARYSGRRGLPITERHDGGRAAGRITRLWVDESGNLYGQPRWNKVGRELLIEEVYDAFSSELARDDAGWYAVGGSLTNYPAVSDLAPVSLSAPVVDIPDAAGGPQATPQEIIMAEETPAPVVETPATPPPAPPEIRLDSPVAQAQMDAALAQMKQQYEHAQKVALEQARMEFERWKADMAAQQMIAAFAQEITTPSLQRLHALPLTSEQVAKFMTSLAAAQRAEFQAMLRSIADTGLVSFEEIGSGGAGKDGDVPGEVIAEFERVRGQKIGTGMSQTDAVSAAIRAVGRDRYNAAVAAKKGGR